MSIEDVTIGEVKELATLFGGARSNARPTLTKKGDKVFIRTLTFYYIGEVVEDNGVFISLKDAAWIADSGRFSEAIEKGTLSEVEPIGNAKVVYSNIVDCIEWVHALPKAAQ